MFIRHPR